MPPFFLTTNQFVSSSLFSMHRAISEPILLNLLSFFLTFVMVARYVYINATSAFPGLAF